MKSNTAILLVDDHPVFRAGLRAMLEEEDDFRVVGEAGDGEAAVEEVRKHSPDVVVMDITMPNVDGIEATRRITTEFPAVKILPLSIHGGKRFVENMLRAGAAGYVLKESAPEDLVEAIRKVQAGGVFLSPAVSGVVLAEYMRLLNQPGETGGEEELVEEDRKLLGLIAEGYAPKEIAIALDLSPSAVQAARRRLMKKLGLGSVTELTEYAAAHRWAEGERGVEMSSKVDGSENMPILATKFYPPALPTKFVPRDRLLKRLEEGRQAAVTLISAPAGYGKSTLLADWLRAKERSTVWYSLDAEDSEFGVFLNYLVTAVESVFPGACANTRAVLAAPQLPPTRVVVGYLVNDLNAVEVAFDLVLEDFHRIRGEAVSGFLSEVFLHPPENVHWFILTRHDPPLPLAGLRASSRLCEVGFEDLRCSAEEAALVLKRALGRELDSKSFQRVCDSAEGWITGLHLAALALAHHDNPDRLIAEMESARSGIHDYLSEQVLTAQSPEVLRGLLKTSILDRFCAPLCEALFQTDENCGLSGEEFIGRLLASGLFVVSMDSSGTWYRFHHLFRHVLLRRLGEAVEAKGIAELHLRAMEWLEEHQLIDEALGHASKGGAGEACAGIVERHLDARFNADDWQVVERWLGRIPEDLQEQQPRLLLAAACVAEERSQLQKIPALMGRVEALIRDRDVEPALSGSLNMFRGQIEYWQGRPGPGLDYFRQAREQIPSSLALIAGENELHLGLARQALGQGREAREELQAQMQSTAASVPVYLSRLHAGQAIVDLLSGELASAASEGRRLESHGRKHGMLYTRIWGLYLRALVQFHWFELELALHSFSELAENVYLMHSRTAVDSLCGLSLVCQARGQDGEALKTMRKLRSFVEEFDDPQLLEVVGSCEARLALWQGDLATATRWQRSFRDPLDCPSVFLWLEDPAVTECRVLVARGGDADVHLAAEKLAALREGLGELHNTCGLIDVLVLEAMRLEKQDQRDDALVILCEVIEMTEPGGWVRPFVEAGAPMADLLRDIEPAAHLAEFVRQLRAAMEGEDPASADAPAAEESTIQPLIEPLTNRELDVLELIAKRLYDKEIADQLSISAGTVKSHLKHIYQKLNVGNRRQAVEKAQALGML